MLQIEEEIYTCQLRPKEKLFVSCKPTLTSFYSKKGLPQSFFSSLTPKSSKNMHKTHIFEQRNNQKIKEDFSNLPTLFCFRPLQETNNFF